METREENIRMEKSGDGGGGGRTDGWPIRSRAGRF
jgi:hypothetical protein